MVQSDSLSAEQGLVEGVCISRGGEAFNYRTQCTAAFK